MTAKPVESFALNLGADIKDYIEKVSKPFGDHAEDYTDAVTKVASRLFLVNTTTKIINDVLGEGTAKEPTGELDKVFNDAYELTFLVLASKIKPKNPDSLRDQFSKDTLGFIDLVVKTTDQNINLLQAEAVGTTQ